MPFPTFETWAVVGSAICFLGSVFLATTDRGFFRVLYAANAILAFALLIVFLANV